MIETGSRTRQNALHIRPQQGTITRSYGKDLGLSKLVNGGSLTFNAGTGQISGAASTFSGFKGNEVIEVEGTNLNNGFFSVTATDSSTYLTVDPPPKNEGPIATFLRTA